MGTRAFIAPVSVDTTRQRGTSRRRVQTCSWSTMPMRHPSTWPHQRPSSISLQSERRRRSNTPSRFRHLPLFSPWCHYTLRTLGESRRSALRRFRHLPLFSPWCSPSLLNTEASSDWDSVAIALDLTPRYFQTNDSLRLSMHRDSASSKV